MIRFAAEDIRDQALNVPGNFLINLFPVTLPLRLDIGSPARFANISDGPYTQAGGKIYAQLALVVNSLIHADCNISSIKARLSQLIPIADFSKASFTVLLE